MPLFNYIKQKVSKSDKKFMKSISAPSSSSTSQASQVIDIVNEENSIDYTTGIQQQTNGTIALHVLLAYSITFLNRFQTSKKPSKDAFRVHCYAKKTC